MSSTTLMLAGLAACVAWQLAFFELVRIFNRPNAGDLVKSELVQMLTAVTLVCLLCGAMAVLTQGMDKMLPFGVLVGFGGAVVTFFTLFAVVHTLVHRRAAVAAGAPASPTT